MPPDNHGYSLQRYELHADLHLNEHLFFLELYSALEYGRPGGPRPAIDQEQMGIETGFVDFTVRIDGQQRDLLTVRVGRQEMEFGSGRLIDVREGPNVRQNWDGIRATLLLRGWQIDAFGTSVPRIVSFGINKHRYKTR